MGVFQCEYIGAKIYCYTVVIKHIGAMSDFLGKILTSVHRYEQDKH